MLYLVLYTSSFPGTLFFPIPQAFPSPSLTTAGGPPGSSTCRDHSLYFFRLSPCPHFTVFLCCLQTAESTRPLFLSSSAEHISSWRAAFWTCPEMQQDLSSVSFPTVYLWSREKTCCLSNGTAFWELLCIKHDPVSVWKHHLDSPSFSCFRIASLWKEVFHCTVKRHLTPFCGIDACSVARLRERNRVKQVLQTMFTWKSTILK